MSDNKLPAEKILIIFGMLIFGLIITYNAYFIPEVPSEVKHSGSVLFKKDIEEDNGSNIVDGKVNINTATREEIIEFLPGVGEKIAGRILSYRETYGGFKSIEEIMQIKGIGEKFFENIKDFIVV